MSRKVALEEILDLQQYELERDAYRRRLFEVKAARRVHVGPYLTFLFENADTVRYQVQEMVRSERMVKPEAIQYEIDTYNELIGEPGQLGATLLIEIDDKDLRQRLLTAWLDLPDHLYATLPDGTDVRPLIDERQRGDTRLSAVQFLLFPVAGEAPTALGIELPGHSYETVLSPAIRTALAADASA